MALYKKFFHPFIWIFQEIKKKFSIYWGALSVRQCILINQRAYQVCKICILCNPVNKFVWLICKFTNQILNWFFKFGFWSFNSESDFSRNVKMKENNVCSVCQNKMHESAIKIWIEWETTLQKLLFSIFIFLRIKNKTKSRIWFCFSCINIYIQIRL